MVYVPWKKLKFLKKTVFEKSKISYLNEILKPKKAKKTIIYFASKTTFLNHIRTDFGKNK